MPTQKVDLLDYSYPCSLIGQSMSKTNLLSRIFFLGSDLKQDVILLTEELPKCSYNV